MAKKSFGMGLLESAGSAGASGVIGMGLDALTAGARKKREKEMLKYQQELSQQNAQLEHSLAKDMWNYTNYPNQVKKLKEAGLSPALMYGSQGQGGTTSGAGSIGDSASGGVQDPITAMGIGLQGQLTQSQIKLNEAQAYKLNTSAEKEGGVDTEKVKTETAARKWETDLSQKLNSDNYIQDLKASLTNKVFKEEYENEKLQAEWEAFKEANFTKTKDGEGWIWNDKNSPIVKSLKAGVEKTIIELNNLKKQGNILEAERKIKEFESKLTEQGLSPQSPWYVKIMADLLGKAGIKLTNDTANQIK